MQQQWLWWEILIYLLGALMALCLSFFVILKSGRKKRGHRFYLCLVCFALPFLMATLPSRRLGKLTFFVFPWDYLSKCNFCNFQEMNEEFLLLFLNFPSRLHMGRDLLAFFCENTIWSVKLALGLLTLSLFSRQKSEKKQDRNLSWQLKDKSLESLWKSNVWTKGPSRLKKN